jgi:hypothetical protein
MEYGWDTEPLHFLCYMFTHGFVEVHMEIDVAFIYWVDQSMRLSKYGNSNYDAISF